MLRRHIGQQIDVHLPLPQALAWYMRRRRRKPRKLLCLSSHCLLHMFFKVVFFASGESSITHRSRLFRFGEYLKKLQVSLSVPSSLGFVTGVSNSQIETMGLTECRQPVDILREEVLVYHGKLMTYLTPRRIPALCNSYCSSSILVVRPE